MNKPSSNWSRKCCYCEKSCKENNMRSVPRNQIIRGKYIEILGKRFAMNLETKKNAFICRTHFERDIKVRKTDQLPVRMSEENEEKKDENEEKQEAQQNIKRCCYCEKSGNRSEMTEVTRNREQLIEWIRILGHKFYENISGKSTRYICRDHFEKNFSEKRSKFDLPIRMKVEQEDENPQENDEFEIPDDFDEVYSRGHDIRRRLCDFCGISQPKKEFKVCKPTSRDFARWVEIIGPRFVERSTRKKWIFICVSHLHLLKQKLLDENDPELRMKTRSQNKRKIENDEVICEKKVIKIEEEEESVESPVKLELNEEKEKIEMLFLPVKEEIIEEGLELDSIQEIMKKTIVCCRFCDIEMSSIEMVETPTNVQDLSKWCQIYGETFTENVFKYSEPHFICMSHVFEKNC